MKTACAKWKDALLEAALAGAAAGELEDHLSACAGCARTFAALRAQQERMNALLPLVAGSAEPSAGFRARLLAQIQAHCPAKRIPLWRAYVLAGTAAVILVAAIASHLYRSEESTPQDIELASAQKLASWRAPSDVFLETPGKEVLRSMPSLGESFVKIPITTNKED